MTQGQWYYCLLHHAVEPYEGCRSETRLGPYETREEAEHALEIAAERHTEWEEDPRFNDPDEDDGDEDEATEGWGPFRH